MYKNPGKKLKSLARFILWIAIILNVLIFIGIYLGAVEEIGRQSTIALVLFIALGVVIGMLLGWLASIILYAFGELVEDTHSIRKELNRIDYKLSKIPIIQVQGEIEETYIEDDE